LKKSESRQEKAAGCNGNGAPADKHIFNPGSCARRLNVYTAGPVHLNALFKHHGSVAALCSMTNEVCNGASGGRAGGRIFAVVELHAVVPASTGRRIGARHAEEEFGIAAGQISLRSMLRNGEARCDFERAEWNDAEGDAGGDSLDRQLRIKIRDVEAQRLGHGLAVVHAAECGIGLPHAAEDAGAGLPGVEGHRDTGRGEIQRVALPGQSVPLTFRRTEDALEIDLPPALRNRIGVALVLSGRGITAGSLGDYNGV